MITLKRIPIQRCTNGVYLRWWYNGWHYYCFTNDYEIVMRSQVLDVMTTQVFSVISKIERPTKLTADYAYQISVTAVKSENIDGFNSLLIAELVEQYTDGTWYEVQITRGAHGLQSAGDPAYELTFEVTRKELPNTAAVYQKSQYLYIGDTLADLDDDEIIPQNKQVNDIAEMQDRQSDFTATFKVRKSRAMRALFELSGEVGANTNYPYEAQICKLVQDGIEVITDGTVVLNKVDDEYYHICVYSGNLNFFNALEGLKLNDLTLASANHTWNAATQAASNASDLAYCYPLCEPSNDAGMLAMTDDGSRAEVYGGWLWPFVKAKTIWDEIISASGYTVTGKILTDVTFNRLFLPIAGLTIPKGYSDKFLYSAYWSGSYAAPNNTQLGQSGFSGAILINGTEYFRQGYYYLPFDATYKIKVIVIGGYLLSTPPTLGVYKNGSYQGDMTYAAGFLQHEYTYEVTGTAGQHVEVLTSPFQYYYYNLSIIEIKDAKINYGSTVEPAKYLPDLTQTDFLKLICNLFGLIPQAEPRKRTIHFWNYNELYANIPQARDWSAYLSEHEDEVEFKFGDYAQRNNLRYKDCDDVLLNAGAGVMQINDATLPLNKDVVQLPVATCDEVIVLTDQTVAQIDFNKYDDKTGAYLQNESIDPRLVYISQAPNTKTFGIRDAAVGGTSYDTVAPLKASTSQISFSALISNYGSLARMLTKTNLRRAKFNLPVYEVAGFRHDLPIYLRQYKAYFYVNKISNYVAGRLCSIELIKL